MTAPSEHGISPEPAAGPPLTAASGSCRPASSADLFGLTVCPPERRGSFVVTPPLLNTRATLWGGCGLAAAIAFVQACGGRDCVWAHAQFLAPVHAGATVELTVASDGLSQVGVHATVEGLLAFRVGGTFGRVAGAAQLFGPSGSWAPSPSDCPLREYPSWLAFPRDGMISMVEQRWARPPRTVLDGTPGTGRSALWLRPYTRMPMDSVLLALLADFAPAALIEAIGDMSAGTSLDNHLRVVAPPHGEWILLDVRVEAIVRNVAQMRARMYDESGALIATASQSALVHRVRPPGRRTSAGR